MATSNLPAAWNQSAKLDGLALTDKSALIEIPFRITGVSFRTSSTNGARLVEVDAEGVDGSTFTFNDSSTGVKEQLVSYLGSIGKDHVVELDDEYLALSETEKLVVPDGLRVSEYDVPEKINGRETGRLRKARTFYLTTSGERAKKNADKAAKRTTRPAAAS